MEDKIKPIAFTTEVQHTWPYNNVTYNGYVAVPPSHPLHGKSYYDDCVRNLDVHGGITWADGAMVRKKMCGMVTNGKPVEGKMEDIGDDWWVLGFDTMHLGDSVFIWNHDAVVEETRRLLEQINKIGYNENGTIAGAQEERAETHQRD